MLINWNGRASDLESSFTMQLAPCSEKVRSTRELIERFSFRGIRNLAAVFSIVIALEPSLNAEDPLRIASIRSGYRHVITRDSAS